MAKLNISMPDELRAFIESRVRTGEYQSASDYLRDLIRHDHEKIDQLLFEGVNSGDSLPLDMKNIKKKAVSPASKRTGLIMPKAAEPQKPETGKLETRRKAFNNFLFFVTETQGVRH